MYIPLSLTESICTFTLPNSTWRSIFHSLATIFPACVLRCWKCTAECSPSSPLMLCVPSLPSNLHSWFFHFHLSPLLPYPLFPSHSVFLASCFPFLSSLMCLSSPLLPPHCFLFLFFPPAHYRTSPVLCCLMCCWILPHPSSRIFCFSSVSLPSPLLLPFLSRLSDYLVSTAL